MDGNAQAQRIESRKRNGLKGGSASDGHDGIHPIEVRGSIGCACACAFVGSLRLHPMDSKGPLSAPKITLLIIAPPLCSCIEPPLSSVLSSDKFHDRFLIIDKTTLIHGMRRRNASRFGGQVAQRRQRRPQGPAGIPQPPRQEVLRLLITRQVQHPRHRGKDVNTIGKTAKPRNFGK